MIHIYCDTWGRSVCVRAVYKCVSVQARDRFLQVLVYLHLK